MLKEIHIKNYRGIKDLKIKDFKRINLLVGDNNSGKTSILEAIGLGVNYDVSGIIAFESFRETGRLPVVTNLNDPKMWDDFEYLFNEKKSDNGFIIESKINKQTGEKLVRLSASVSNEVEQFAIPQIASSFNQIINQNVVNSLILEYSEDGGNHAKLGYSRNGTYTSSSNLMQSFTPISLITSSPAKTHELILPMQNIAKENGEKFFSDIAQKIDLKIKTIKTAGDQILADIGNISIPLKYMGEGLTSVLNILLKIRSNKNGILLLDEIENGLHWRTQEVLWKAVIGASIENNVQIIATTHSLDTIKALNKVYAEDISLSDKDDVRLFQIYKTPKDFAEVLDIKTIAGMINNNYEPR
jgi:AAA15 family ATPase/GTPase